MSEEMEDGREVWRALVKGREVEVGEVSRIFLGFMSGWGLLA